MVRHRVVSSKVVSYKVVGIEDSSKTVVRKSDSGQQVNFGLIALFRKRFYIKDFKLVS